MSNCDVSPALITEMQASVDYMQDLIDEMSEIATYEISNPGFELGNLGEKAEEIAASPELFTKFLIEFAAGRAMQAAVVLADIERCASELMDDRELGEVMRASRIAFRLSHKLDQIMNTVDLDGGPQEELTAEKAETGV